MNNINLTPEELEGLKIHNQSDFEKFKTSIHEFRQKNNLEPVTFEPINTEHDAISEDVSEYVKTKWGVDSSNLNHNSDLNRPAEKSSVQTITLADIEIFNKKYK